MTLRWTRRAAAAPAQSGALTASHEADARPVAHAGERSRGQVLVIFALILTFLLLMSALVVDLAWLWGNTLRIQRAADAAALAGVVHLPGNPGLAYSTAVSEATKNGYVNGANAVSVSPIKDPYNARKLDVTVSAPVKTFFLGIIGMNQFTISRQADAEYILPVPMGSPLNYYGVGDFRRISSGVAGSTPANMPTATATPSQWTNPTRGYTTDGLFATTATNGQLQVYRNYGLSVPAGYTVLGIEITSLAKASVASGCRIDYSLSWDGGTTWTSLKSDPLNGTLSPTTLGSPSDLWGRGSWSPSDFSDANFRVRATNVKGSGCSAAAVASLDSTTVKVYYRAPASQGNVAINDPYSGPLTSQGFWGAVFTKGGVRENGDRYSPANWSGGSPASNPDYTPGGYNYTVEVSAGGQVWLYDATFCGTGPTSFGGWFGAGDHWTGLPNNGGNGYGAVSTHYRLYNTNGTDYLTSDDTQVADSGTTFDAKNQTDQSGNLGTPQAAPGATDCAADPYHGTGIGSQGWYQLSSGLPAGKYRLNVQTSDPSNNTVAAENLFSMYVKSPGKPRVYGGGRMAAYTNVENSGQVFYLAQIDKVHAGKTMEITLFDPGDVSGDAYLKILSPDGNTYTPATFDYVSDAQCTGSSDACSATGRTQIHTHSSAGSAFNNTVVTISIPLPSTYGSTGLTPPGETDPGWWKIQYDVVGGNDTTTWEVNIRGNPVRLVVP